eukprot:2673664-Amphidinium_carterae.1
MPVDEGLRLEEPQAKRHQADVAGGVENCDPRGRSAGAARGPKLEAHGAASAVEPEEEEEEYVDDVYDTLLRPELVRAARQLKLDWIKSREVYKRVPLEECFERTKKKKKPISM